MEAPQNYSLRNNKELPEKKVAILESGPTRESILTTTTASSRAGKRDPKKPRKRAKEIRPNPTQNRRRFHTHIILHAQNRWKQGNKYMLLTEEPIPKRKRHLKWDTYQGETHSMVLGAGQTTPLRARKNKGSAKAGEKVEGKMLRYLQKVTYSKTERELRPSTAQRAELGKNRIQRQG